MTDMLGGWVAERTTRERIYGVVVGVVTNTEDPEKLGRVKVKLPWLAEGVESNWARVATLMAGEKHATWFLPCVKDEVLVVFEQGLLERPYVIGALYNGKAKPPVEQADGRQQILQSRTGHVIMFEDDLSAGGDTSEDAGVNPDDSTQKKKAAKKGKASETPSTITIKTAKGQLITLDDKKGEEKITVTDKAGSTVVLDKSGIKVTAKKDLALKAEGTLTIEGKEVKVTSTGGCEITGKEVKVTANGGFDVNSGALKVTK